MALLVPTVRDLDRPSALAPTGRPGSGTAAPSGPVALPPGCRLTAWLDVEGAGEAQRLALVKGGWGRADRILKLYRPYTGPAVAVRAAWPEAEHVVRLHRSDVFDGRVFEIMDDVGDPLGGDRRARRTTLRDVLAAHPGGLAEDVVVDVVRQLGEALAALGRAKLAHLDMRPENVLVARRPDGGFDVTLADLGSSVALARPVMWVPQAPASAYAAPEVLLPGIATAATDWWSLGILAAELAAGGHPLAREDIRNIKLQLHDDNLPVPAGLPGRVAALVAGLTVHRDIRWGAAEVAAWADGGSPAVPGRRPAPGVPPSRSRARTSTTSSRSWCGCSRRATTPPPSSSDRTRTAGTS